MEIGSRILEQVNAWPERGELLTDRLGEARGKRARSYFFCFDYIWAVMCNVSFNKNDVARRITDNINVEALIGSNNTNDLRVFSNKLDLLHRKFSRSDSFSQSNSAALTELIANLNAAIPPREGMSERSPSPSQTKVQDLVEFCQENFRGVFSNDDERNRERLAALMNGLHAVTAHFPYILPIRGDGACAYRALATLKYVKACADGPAPGSLEEFQENFVERTRNAVADFLANPVNLEDIPQVILNTNLPEAITSNSISDEDIRDTYGGTTRPAMIESIRAGTKSAASALELWVMGHLEEESAGQGGERGFIEIQFAATFNAAFVVYPYEHPGSTPLANAEEIRGALPSGGGLFDGIGAFISLSPGHYNCALSRHAAERIIAANPHLRGDNHLQLGG